MNQQVAHWKETISMRKVIRWAAFVAIATGYSIPAHAVTPEPDPRVCTEFFRADLVFTGTVTGEFSVFDTEGFLVEIIYNVEPVGLYKGQSAEGNSATPVLQVRTGVHSAGWYLDVEETYLIFAHEINGHFNDGEMAYSIGSGGNSGLLSESKEAIGEIKRLLATHDTATTGNIRGWVYDYPNRDVEGIGFVATDGDREYTASADAGGWFEFDLPPGTYSVAPETAQKNLRAHSLTYDDPDKVEVKAGECAEVAFRFR